MSCIPFAANLSRTVYIMGKKNSEHFEKLETPGFHLQPGTTNRL